MFLNVLSARPLTFLSTNANAIANSWVISAAGTIVGSTLSFLVSRHYFHSYAERLVSRDSRFAALALTLKHDGLKLLIMIRLCPLPYSLMNGALATVPTVSWQTFALATAIASLKLMLHIFVGAQLGEIAAHGEEMDTRTKVVSYISIVIGAGVGIATGIFMYRQTKRRAAELQAQEADAVRRASGDSLRWEYADDPAALEAAQTLRERDDDISLHTEPYEDWDDDPQEMGRYRDDASPVSPLSPTSATSPGDGGLVNPDVFANGDISDDEDIRR
jgi:uncharacterized membrane protein YdjX (TVP38/TMEM64 family)